MTRGSEVIHMSHLFYRFTQGQQSLSKCFDRLLPAEYQVDGNKDFLDHWIEPYLKYGSVVYDVGGGKNPAIGLGEKRRLALRLVGLDIEQDELAASGSGVYDEKICADIAQYRGQADAYLVVC